jgi:hypothetical protein
MNRKLLASFAVTIITGTAAFAQTGPTTNSTTPPAISTTKGDSNTTAAPVAGKNSFTENQAREQLDKHGYSDVSTLSQDNQSIWRGTGVKDGKTVDVAVDYQGNVVGD